MLAMPPRSRRYLAHQKHSTANAAGGAARAHLHAAKGHRRLVAVHKVAQALALAELSVQRQSGLRHALHPQPPVG